ncbi:MAG: hypothetical protein LJE96_18280, partial [Deltaproteobacteria bacterium]|nr:hypothetical protein [Deltaproteobacteria bacterium]
SDRIRLEVKGHDYDLLLYDNEKLKPHAPIKAKGGPTVVGGTASKAEQASITEKKSPILPQSQTSKNGPAVKQNPTITNKTNLKNSTRK